MVRTKDNSRGGGEKVGDKYSSSLYGLSDRQLLFGKAWPAVVSP